MPTLTSESVRRSIYQVHLGSALHYGATIIPKGIDTRAASDMVHRETKSKAVGLEHAKVYTAFDL